MSKRHDQRKTVSERREQGRAKLAFLGKRVEIGSRGKKELGQRANSAWRIIGKNSKKTEGSYKTPGIRRAGAY